jgi:hypothetical protein
MGSVGTSARSFARYLLAGPNTPLYRTTWRPGGGMMPTRRRRNATGSMTRCAPVGPRALELVRDAPVGGPREALLRERRSRPVPAQPFERGAIVRSDDDAWRAEIEKDW